MPAQTSKSQMIETTVEIDVLPQHAMSIQSSLERDSAKLVNSVTTQIEIKEFALNLDVVSEKNSSLKVKAPAVKHAQLRLEPKMKTRSVPLIHVIMTIENSPLMMVPATNVVPIKSSTKIEMHVKFQNALITKSLLKKVYVSHVENTRLEPNMPKVLDSKEFQDTNVLIADVTQTSTSDKETTACQTESVPLVVTSKDQLLWSTETPT